MSFDLRCLNLRSDAAGGGLGYRAYACDVALSPMCLSFGFYGDCLFHLPDGDSVVALQTSRMLGRGRVQGWAGDGFQLRGHDDLLVWWYGVVMI